MGRDCFAQRALRHLMLAIAMAMIPMSSATAQSPSVTRIVSTPGGLVRLGEPAECVRSPSANVSIATAADKKQFAVYHTPSNQTVDVAVSIVTGKGTGAECAEPKMSDFVVAVDRTPQTSDATLSKAFNILLSAFVLAILLESAFALLFNWRLFLEFFVGKAWRTPIMFLGALLVVRNFHMDLMAELFDAYRPSQSGDIAKSTWFTSALTAMILAGGSVGVNRILIALGFRSQVRPEAELPKLDEKQAWMAVRVDNAEAEKFIVGVQETALDATAPATAIVGFISRASLGQRLKQLLFPSQSRVPTSGGRVVSTEKVYRIVVDELKPGGKSYDATTGAEINSEKPARPVRFGSRAIVDFNVRIP